MLVGAWTAYAACDPNPKDDVTTRGVIENGLLGEAVCSFTAQRGDKVSVTCQAADGTRTTTELRRLQ